MPSPISLVRTFLVSIWLEGLIYGFFVCIFALSLIINLGTHKRQTAHSRAMFIVGVITFILATLHISINCVRMMRGYVDHSSLVGGPVGYLGILPQWDNVFKNTIYTAQSIVGDSVAVYRCWVLWNRSFFVVSIPLLMVLGSAVSAVMAFVVSVKAPPGTTMSESSLDVWIKIFYVLAVAQNIITTTLMGWRIAAADNQVATYRLGRGNLIPVLRILVESAALYLTAQIILLVLYLCDKNAQFIALEAITPIIQGITFNAMTIRITLRSQSQSSAHTVEIATDAHRPTIGSMPLRHISVTVTQTKHTDYDTESQSAREIK